jgi:hypothetical protein
MPLAPHYQHDPSAKPLPSSNPSPHYQSRPALFSFKITLAELNCGLQLSPAGGLIRGESAALAVPLWRNSITKPENDRVKWSRESWKWLTVGLP